MPQVIRPPDLIADITGLQSALNARQTRVEKNVSDGYSGLDEYELLDPDQIPDYGDIDGGGFST